MSSRHPPKKTLLAAALGLALALAASGAFAQTATEKELARRLDQLAAELANVKAQLAQMQQQRAAAVPAGAFGSTAPAASSFRRMANSLIRWRSRADAGAPTGLSPFSWSDAVGLAKPSLRG